MLGTGFLRALAGPLPSGRSAPLAASRIGKLWPRSDHHRRKAGMINDELKRISDMITGLTLYLPLLVAAAQRSGKSTGSLLSTTRFGHPSTASGGTWQLVRVLPVARHSTIRCKHQ